MRSMMYLWGTFAASGTKPVTFAFQLLQPGAKIQQPKLKGEWTIYASIAFLYKFMKISDDGLKSNIRTLIVTALYRTLLMPYVEKATSIAKSNIKEEEKRHRMNINIALRWNYPG